MLNPSQKRQKLIQAVRLYPIITVALLFFAYLAGGFSDKNNSIIPKDLTLGILTFYIFFAPAIYILGFIVVGHASDRERRQLIQNQPRLNYDDAFALPSEEMRGYKLAVITEREPTFRGLTGDSYTADDSAICTKFPEHTPPVSSCECGFYAYRNRADAKFEGSLNPDTFLLEVDLYGIGFRYENGFRAETQVVKQIILPKRCMRCRIFRPTVFSISHRMGYQNYSWMQWQVRCNLCTMSFKDTDKLSIEEMQEKLGLAIQ